MSDQYPPTPPPPPAEPVESKRRIGPREIFGLIALAVLIVFIFENTRRVKIRFIVPEVKAPLFVALLAAALVGALAFWLIQHRVASRRRKKD